MLVLIHIPKPQNPNNFNALVNACILHDLLPITQLGPNPYLYEISEHHLQQAIYRPDYIHYGLLCNVLSHRINKSRGGIQMPGLEERFFHYRGIAIGSLSEHLADEGGQRSDAILAGVMTVLLLDVSPRLFVWGMP